MSVVVVGQIGRDLVLRTDGFPDAGGSAGVTERLERLGGKGANQAVGLVQLGEPTALVAVAGDDPAGDLVLRQAAADGIDVGAVCRRGQTALLVDVVDTASQRRLFEHIPDTALLTADDVRRAAALFARTDTVSVQLQQPSAAVLAAARLGREHGALVVLDGVAEPEVRDELLALADVVRADAKEARLLAGEPIESADAARDLGARLLTRGPRLVALEVDGVGDLVMWPDGSRLLAFSADAPVVDRTGAGDAFVAGLIAALRRGANPEQAGEAASAAARSVVGRLGGRPDLSVPVGPG